MIQSFHELSVRALRKIASTYNLHTMMKGYSKLTKEELIANLQKHLKIENDNLYFISKTHSFPIPKLPPRKYKKTAKKEKPVADSGEFEKAVKQFKKIEEEFKPENYKVKSIEELMPKKVSKEDNLSHQPVELRETYREYNKLQPKVFERLRKLDPYLETLKLKNVRRGQDNTVGQQLNRYENIETRNTSINGIESSLRALKYLDEQLDKYEELMPKKVSKEEKAPFPFVSSLEQELVKFYKLNLETGEEHYKENINEYEKDLKYLENRKLKSAKSIEENKDKISRVKIMLNTNKEKLQDIPNVVKKIEKLKNEFKIKFNINFDDFLKTLYKLNKNFQLRDRILLYDDDKLMPFINQLYSNIKEKGAFEHKKGGVMRTNFQPIIPVKMTPEERMKRREEFYSKKDPVPNYRLMLKGGGAQPARNALHQMAKASYEKNPPREIGGFVLDQSYPTLKFYKDEASKTIIVAIRGTNATDTEDLKADASIAINGLENSRRFKKDLDILRSYQYNNSPNKYDYYGVGHSLGGAVMDGFLDMNLLKSGISYNPALQPKNFGKNNRDQRIYADDDLLYKTLGHNDPNAEVRKTKKGFFSRVVKALAPSVISKPYEALEAHKLDQFEGGKKRRRNLK